MTLPAIRFFRAKAALAAAGGAVLLLLSACVLPTAVPVPKQDPAAVRVIERYLAARGGPEAILALQTESAEGDVTIMPGNQAGKISLKEVAADNEAVIGSLANAGAFGAWPRVRFTFLHGGSERIRASDGHTGWAWTTGLGFGLINPAPLVLEYGLHADLSILSRYFTIRQLPDQALAIDIRQPRDLAFSGSCQVLELTPFGGRPETWFFDSATGLLRRKEGPPAASGIRPSVEFDDYQEIQGVKVPLRWTYENADGSEIVVRWRTVVFNTPLNGVDFNPPPDAVARNEQINGILARYVAACGGARALMQIRTRVTRETVTGRDGSETMKVIYQKAPDMALIVSQTPGVGQEQWGFDGKAGWELSDIQGFRFLKGLELREIMSVGDIALPLHLARDFPYRRWLGEKIIDGQQTEGFTLSDGTSTIGAHYYDRKTGQLVWQETTNNNGAQGYVAVKLKFSDFRSVDGVVMPFRTELSNATAHSVTTVQSVVQNQPLADTLFAPKQDN